jgi:hypothetical protein
VIYLKCYAVLPEVPRNYYCEVVHSSLSMLTVAYPHGIVDLDAGLLLGRECSRRK